MQTVKHLPTDRNPITAIFLSLRGIFGLVANVGHFCKLEKRHVVLFLHLLYIYGKLHIYNIYIGKSQAQT